VTTNKPVQEEAEDPSSSRAADESQPLKPNRSLITLEESESGSESRSVFSWLLRLFGRRRNGSTIREDLADALQDDEVLAQGFSPEERAMLTSILHLQETRVEELMVPRTDIIAVKQDTSLADLLKIFEDSGHSRMPVYNETLDDPRGMIHIRDVVAHILKVSSLSRAEIAKRRKLPPANLDLKKVNLSRPISELKLLREVMFIPPSMGARELMARMQAERVQIEDEHDDEQNHIQDTGDGTFVCDAKAELDDLRELLGEEFVFGEHEEDVDTIGGLIFDILGRVPVRGEVITKNSFEFRIVEADPRRIRKVELMRFSRRRPRARNH